MGVALTLMREVEMARRVRRRVGMRDCIISGVVGCLLLGGCGVVVVGLREEYNLNMGMCSVLVLYENDLATETSEEKKETTTLRGY